MKSVILKMMVLSACTSMIFGCTTEYTCGKFPDAGCQPISSAYEDTNSGVEDYRRDFYKGKGKTDVAESDEYSRDIKVRMSKPTLLTDMAPGNPIIKERRVVRMLLNNWRDQENDLHSGEYIFMRIGDEEWVTQ